MQKRTKNQDNVAEKPLIVYLGPFYLPDRNAACHRAINNAKGLAELGYKVRIIGFETKTRTGDLGEPHPGVSLRTVDAGSGLSSYRVDPRSALAELKGGLQGQSVSHVICYNYPALTQAAIQLWCLCNRVTFLSDITEWNTKGGRGLLRNIARAVEISLRVRVLARLGGGIITTSPWMTAYYGRRASRPISELPTLFDKTMVETCPLPASPSGAPVRLVFVGPGFDTAMRNVDPAAMKERTDLVLRMVGAALDRGQKLRLDIFGLDRNRYEAAFPQDTSILDVWGDFITFHGRVPHKRILDALYAAHASVIFRDNKRANNVGFPTKFAESLMTGTPVVIDRIASIAAYHDHPHVLTIDRADPEQMAQDMLAHLDTWRERERTTPSAPESYQSFHYANFVNEMRSAFRQAS